MKRTTTTILMALLWLAGCGDPVTPGTGSGDAGAGLDGATVADAGIEGTIDAGTGGPDGGPVATDAGSADGGVADPCLASCEASRACSTSGPPWGVSCAQLCAIGAAQAERTSCTAEVNALYVCNLAAGCGSAACEPEQNAYFGCVADSDSDRCTEYCEYTGRTTFPCAFDCIYQEQRAVALGCEAELAAFASCRAETADADVATECATEADAVESCQCAACESLSVQECLGVLCL